MNMGKNRQQHEELKQLKQPSLVNYFDISNIIKNLSADKTANMHAYRVYIKYNISQNLRRLGLLNKARRIQRIHNIFRPLSVCIQIILTQHHEYPPGSHLSRRSIPKVKTTKKLCSVFLRTGHPASVFTLPKL